MSSCKIRFATVDDIDDIMHFFGENWKKDHILSRDRELFEYIYRDGNKVNFVLGIDEEGKIQGTFGFERYGKDSEDIALEMWKANPKISGLGILLLNFLEKEGHFKGLSAGINMTTTSQIYKYLGKTVGEMKQWYRLNDINDYRIGKITNRVIPSVESPAFSVEELKNDSLITDDFIAQIQDASAIPYKSANYLRKRYFHHPRYNYHVFVVKDNSKPVALYVLRVQEHDGARVLRFVDYVGSAVLLPCITESIDTLMHELDAEYIDMYQTGIADVVMQAAGWILVETSGNIIPNYFSPYEQRNIKIFYTASKPETVLFRGDSDQDRPN